MDLSLRAATADDAPALTDLARRAKASWGYPAPWLAAWAPQLAFDAGYLAANRVQVAVDGATPVGVIALEADPAPEIGHLWVDPELQGRGIGGLLMRWAVATATREGWPALRIVSDPHALGFYRGLGAVEVGTIPAPVCGEARELPVLRLVIDPT